MALYWNPFWQLDAISRELDRALNTGKGSGSSISRSSFLPGRAARAYPLINIHEDKDSVIIEALAPGVDPATLDISVVRNQLTISGQKNGADKAQPEAYHRNERAAGKFVRTIDLPVEVDEKNVKAEYDNGLIHVTLPKAEVAKPRKIEIKVN